jgi:hypothetical protein
MPRPRSSDLLGDSAGNLIWLGVAFTHAVTHQALTAKLSIMLGTPSKSPGRPARGSHEKLRLFAAQKRRKLNRSK